MEQVQANRLMGVLNLMIDLPPETNFYLGHWADIDTNHNKTNLKKALKCGTSACAVGWAVIALPVWQKAFTFNRADEDNFIICDPAILAKVSSEDYIFSGIAHFLGITDDEAQDMFDPITYDSDSDTNRITRKDVIARITQVLDNNGFEVYDKEYYHY